MANDNCKCSKETLMERAIFTLSMTVDNLSRIEAIREAKTLIKKTTRKEPLDCETCLWSRPLGTSPDADLECVYNPPTIQQTNDVTRENVSNVDLIGVFPIVQSNWVCSKWEFRTPKPKN